jgi:SET domain-containing protein
VTNRFQEHFIVYPFYNPKVRRLHIADQEIIDQYNNKKIAFPVTIVEMNSNKGRGLIANRIIQKGELVSTYSGNVVSLAQASKYKEDSIKDYIFHLICGPDVQTNFVVFPKDFASAGFFMNHTNSRKAKKKVNVNAFITLHNDGPIILMQATRRIHFGEELLYDYNA